MPLNMGVWNLKPRCLQVLAPGQRCGCWEKISTNMVAIGKLRVMEQPVGPIVARLIYWSTGDQIKAMHKVQFIRLPVMVQRSITVAVISLVFPRNFIFMRWIGMPIELYLASMVLSIIAMIQR